MTLVGGEDVGTGIDLYWLPLGAGGQFVRRCGRGYEAICALRQRRSRQPLFHSALAVSVDGRRCAVEMAPAWALHGVDRGVAVVGPVGSPLLGWLRAFRYEVRCWRGGSISDADLAVGSPLRVSGRGDQAAQLLSLVPEVPPLVWGRDELGAGEMWNSNSMTAWLLARAGVDVAALAVPEGGRAPGWQAGLVLAARQASLGTLIGSTRP